MLKKILIASDGSETSRRAARIGIELAKAAGAEALVVYVADVVLLDQIGDLLIFPGAKGKIKEKMMEQGRGVASTIENMAGEAGVKCEVVVAEGNPGDQILRISKTHGADMIVLGSIGKTGLNKFMLGSVAEKVVRNSQIPVLTVPGGMDDHPDQG
jgi:nucleotide-binding universal stress UspA family protein